MLNAVSVIDGFRGDSVMDDLLDVSATEVLLVLSDDVLVASAMEGRRLTAVGLIDSGENSLLVNAVPLGVMGDDLGSPPVYLDLFRSPRVEVIVVLSLGL